MSTPRSEDLQQAINDGLPITTLGEIFKLDHKEVARRLAGRVTPLPSKDKYTRYRIRDAAPYLCEITTDPEELIKRLSAMKLPPALQDAFWKAQLSRQKYESARGELWSTSRVFDVISSAFKVIRLTILMFTDTVEQRTELNPDQRRIIQELGDGLLQSLNKTLQDEFAFYVPAPDEHGAPLSDQEVVSAPADDEEEDPFA
jgi:hypothetical protein